MKNITIVKVGGAVVEDEARLEALLDDFAALEGPKMLVHGGGRRATKVAEALGVESRMVNGRRVTGKDMKSIDNALARSKKKLQKSFLAERQKENG